MIFAQRKSMAMAVAAAMVGFNSAVAAPADEGGKALQKINHIVVIYQENHSFDNLYGGWEGVDGIGNAHVPQVSQAGTVFGCLKQNDVNLASPSPLAVSCTDAANGIMSHFSNAPFLIDDFIAATDTTCPPPGGFQGNGYLKGTGLPGGCTKDLVHRYYQEQYQINGGKMDRYVTGSDAVGLAMGYYDTQALPIYAYLHSPKHPPYVIADNFFQAAFGGSFLNHQWLVAARTPEWVHALNDGTASDLHSVVDANGMPNNYALYTSPASQVKDQALTASCSPGSGRGPTPAGVVCGDFAVNTIQPFAWPYSPGTIDAKRLPPLITPTIGDSLSNAGVDWAWYSGGWANAEGDPTQPGYTNGSGPSCADPDAYAGSTWPKCPDKLFQFHHQAFNYYLNYAPGTTARRNHLRDEAEFIQLAQTSDKKHCNLKPVSFVKPLGDENEHPGYASETIGSDHLVDLIKAVQSSACAKDTMIIVTYDEFGGQADHAAPPGQANATSVYDQWGPGTRIPALVIAPHLPKKGAVDNSVHDTTSILTTIERRFGLSPLGTRDAAVADLSTVFRAHKGINNEDEDLGGD